MIREYTATGATVEEAIENACRELGVSPLDVTPEILKLPKKGFFKKTPAEVRITVQSEEELLKEESVSAALPKKAEAFVREKAEKSAAAPKKEEPKPVKAPASAVPPAPAGKKAEAVPVSAPKAAEPAVEVSAEKEDLQPKIEVAQKYLLDILDHLRSHDTPVRFDQPENRPDLLPINGGDIGTVIGKRGETLDAVQYLVSLVANRQEGEYVRFTINAGNYREKREETLRALAQRMAKKVLKTGRPAALEPMNPYERRIIHAVVTEIEGVYSKSTGEEPNRKVVIKPTARTGASSGSRRDGSRPARGNRPPRSSSPAPQQPGVEEPESMQQAPETSKAESPADEPKVDTKALEGVKLYSKIEL